MTADVTSVVNKGLQVNNSQQPNLSPGQIVQGEVINKSEEGTSVLINQSNIDIPKTVQINENVGEKALFEVTSVGKESVSLKYINKEGTPVNQPSFDLPKIQSKKIDSFDGKIKGSIEAVDIHKDISYEQKAKVLKANITRIVESATDEDVKTIIKENYDIEKITVDMFKALVDQNKIALKIGDEKAFDQAVQDKLANFEETFLNKYGDSTNLKAIIAGLVKAKVPVNDGTIHKIQNAINAYEDIFKMSDKGIVGVMGNRKDFTLEEVVKISHLQGTTVAVSDAVNGLEEQIKSIMTRNGITVNDRRVEIAKQAIASDVLLSEEGLFRLKVMTSHSEAGVTSSEKQILIEAATQALFDQKSALAIDLPLERYQQVEPLADIKVAVDQLNVITDRQISEVIAKGETVNIKNLGQANKSIELVKTVSDLLQKDILIEDKVDDLKQVIDDFKVLTEVQEKDLISLIRRQVHLNRSEKNSLVEVIKKTKAEGSSDLQNTTGKGIESKWTNISSVISRVISASDTFELSKSVDMTIDTLNANAESIVSEASDLQFIKSKLCIEELRLKMSYEAAASLSEKGIKIDLEPLEDLVDQLKRLEKEQFEKALDVHQVDKSDVNIHKMASTMTAVKKLSLVSSYTKIQVLKGETAFTLEAMTRESQLITKETFSEALSSYETMETRVRPDLGDRIENTFKQLDSMLVDMKLPASEENLRVAKALARNEMAISEENIEALKLIDQKISLLTDKLNPTVVASMIKDQMNPVTVDIDELLNHIRQYEKAFLNEDTKLLAEAILKVKESDTLNADEKDSMIGLYRMFRTIAKSKGAAAGFLVKKDMALNIQNLFEAAKYIKANPGKGSKIQANIDDDFGMLETLSYQGEKISDQVAKALGEQKVEINTVNISKGESHVIGIERFLSAFSADKMEVLIKEGLLDEIEKPLSEITEMLKDMKDEGSKFLSKDILERFSDMIKMDIQLLKSFEKYGMKPTAGQLLTHYTLHENPNEMETLFNRMFDSLEKEGLDSTRLISSFMKLSNSSLGDDYEQKLEDVRLEISKMSNDLADQNSGGKSDMQNDFNNAKQLIDYQQQLFREEDYYQIPVFIDQQWTQLNLYYRNHSDDSMGKPEDEMDIYIHFETKNLGKVQSHMHLKDRHMQFSIYSDYESDRSLIMGYQEEMMHILSDGPFLVDQIIYDEVKTESPVDQPIVRQQREMTYLDGKFAAKA